jgi:hypothetical protein
MNVHSFADLFQFQRHSPLESTSNNIINRVSRRFQNPTNSRSSENEEELKNFSPESKYQNSGTRQPKSVKSKTGPGLVDSNERFYFKQKSPDFQKRSGHLNEKRTKDFTYGGFKDQDSNENFKNYHRPGPGYNEKQLNGFREEKGVYRTFDYHDQYKNQEKDKKRSGFHYNLFAQPKHQRNYENCEDCESYYPGELEYQNSAGRSPRSVKNFPEDEVRDSNEQCLFRFKTQNIGKNSGHAIEGTRKETFTKEYKNTTDGNNYKGKNHYNPDSFYNGQQVNGLKKKQGVNNLSNDEDEFNREQKTDRNRYGNQNNLFIKPKFQQNFEENFEIESKNDPIESKVKNSVFRTSKSIKNQPDFRDSNEMFYFQPKNQEPEKRSDRIDDERKKEHYENDFKHTKNGNYEKGMHYKPEFPYNEKQGKGLNEQNGFYYSTEDDDCEKQQKNSKRINDYNGSLFLNTKEAHENLKNEKEVKYQDPSLKTSKILKNVDVQDSNEKFYFRLKSQELEKKSSTVNEKIIKNPIEGFQVPENNPENKKNHFKKDPKNLKISLPQNKTLTKTPDAVTPDMPTKGQNDKKPISERPFSKTQNIKSSSKENHFSIKFSQNSSSESLDSPKPPLESKSKKSLQINQVTLLEIHPQNRRNSAEVLSEDLDLVRLPSLHIPTNKALTNPATPKSQLSVGIQTLEKPKVHSLKSSQIARQSSKISSIKSLLTENCNRLEKMMLKKFKLLQKNLENIDRRFNLAREKLRKLKVLRKKGKKNLSIDVPSLNLEKNFSREKSFERKGHSDASLLLMKFHRNSLEPVNMTPKHLKSPDRLTCAWAEVLTVVKSGRIIEGVLKCLEMQDDLYFIRLLHHFGPCLKFLPSDLAVTVIEQLVQIIQSDFVQHIGNDWVAEEKSLRELSQD